MGQKGEKSIVLNPPNKTQSYPRSVLLSLQKALVCQINNVIFDLRHQNGIFEAKTVAEIAVRAIDISVRRAARLLVLTHRNLESTYGMSRANDLAN